MFSAAALGRLVAEGYVPPERDWLVSRMVASARLLQLEAGHSTTGDGGNGFRVMADPHL